MCDKFTDERASGTIRRLLTYVPCHPMENEDTINLARDILNDHFGPVVEQVGRVLLCHGPLPLREITRFQRLQADDNPDQECLTSAQVRNSLIVLVQHNLVVPDNVKTSELSKYRLDVDEILCRIRFPQFLELVRHKLGTVAQKVMFAVMKNGKATLNHIVDKSGGQKSKEKILVEVQKLLEVGWLRRSQEWDTVTRAPVTSPDKDGKPLKRPRLQAERIEAKPEEIENEHEVYTTNKWGLNLGLCKNLLLRYIEESLDQGSECARVVSALMEGVRLKGSAENPSEVWVQHLKVKEIVEIYSNSFLVGQADESSRHSKEEIEKQIRKLLELMYNQSGLVKKRIPLEQPEAVPIANATPPRSRARKKVNDGEANGAIVPSHENFQQYLSEWAIEWGATRKILWKQTTSNLIREQFGVIGLRIFNLLAEEDVPQKYEERDICQICMIPANNGREILNKMVQKNLVSWQEVPRTTSASSSIGNSLWLYYINRKRVDRVLQAMILKGMLNLRIRFGVEHGKTEKLENRRQGLNEELREELQRGRQAEDILERGYLTLDAAMLIFRHLPLEPKKPTEP